MKKLWFVPVVLVAFALIIYFVSANRVKMSFAEEAKVIYRYGDANVSQSLSDSEFDVVKNIFDGKLMYKDNPSCGFDDDVSIVFSNGQTFCFACDSCPVVYWKDRDRYFKLTDNEQHQLFAILKAYGFRFPCL